MRLSDEVSGPDEQYEEMERSAARDRIEVDEATGVPPATAKQIETVERLYRPTGKIPEIRTMAEAERLIEARLKDLGLAGR